MFQSFPLGDKSSVNLRGEFHTENVTTFDETSKNSNDDAMETESPGTKKASAESQDDDGRAEDRQDSHPAKEETPKSPEIKKDDQESEKQKALDLDALYPTFWSLQAYFSAPTRLFNSEHFSSFRSGLEATLSTFKLIKTDIDTRSSTKAPDDLRRGLKRKRNGDSVEISSSFNPKYLTSRELFDLEVASNDSSIPRGLQLTHWMQISDIAFRRHVLVQALILLDFILSLTPKARSRLPKLINKAVVYNYVVSEEDVSVSCVT
jgi:THO complex subunit 1